MNQHPAAAPINYNVPTAEQLAGDFTGNTINGVAGSTPVTVNGNHDHSSGATPERLADMLTRIPFALPDGHARRCPPAIYDPNIDRHRCPVPKVEHQPSRRTAGTTTSTSARFPQNRWEATGKVDYAISDNTKLSVSYTRQIENDQHPIGVWWTPPWTLPYPSNVRAPPRLRKKSWRTSPTSSIRRPRMNLCLRWRATSIPARLSNQERRKPHHAGLRTSRDCLVTRPTRFRTLKDHGAERSRTSKSSRSTAAFRVALLAPSRKILPSTTTSPRLSARTL